MGSGGVGVRGSGAQMGGSGGGGLGAASVASSMGKDGVLVLADRVAGCLQLLQVCGFFMCVAGCLQVCVVSA